jgi:hypothetical protein
MQHPRLNEIADLELFSMMGNPYKSEHFLKPRVQIQLLLREGFLTGLT